MTPRATRRLRGWAAAAGVAALLSACGPMTDDTALGGATSTTPAASTTTTEPPAPPTTTEPPAPPTTNAATTSAPPTTTTTTTKPTPRPSAPRPRPTTPTPTTTTTKPPPPPRTTLIVGDRGPAVLALQQRLSELGYWLGEPDGQYGGMTQQAVWAFQKAAGLGADGVVGPGTRRALADGVRPRAQLDGDGVEIDLRRQLVMIVRGGRPDIILNTSTGGGYTYDDLVNKGNTLVAKTPTGRFRVSFVVDGPDDGPYGSLFRPRYFAPGIAVHGSPSIPPYPASHGCARVSDAAINMIWARGLMPMGSRVYVH